MNGRNPAWNMNSGRSDDFPASQQNSVPFCHALSALQCCALRNKHTICFRADEAFVRADLRRSCAHLNRIWGRKNEEMGVSCDALGFEHSNGSADERHSERATEWRQQLAGYVA